MIIDRILPDIHELHLEACQRVVDQGIWADGNSHCGRSAVAESYVEEYSDPTNAIQG